MAQEAGQNFLKLVPEQRMAMAISRRHGFVPGGDLERLVKCYADIDYLAFPVDDVDGVSVNLKNPHRRSEILINTRITEVRQRFTLAHEFGHVIIPWHFGTIFSSIDRLDPAVNWAYREMEAEANRFAAELLMPHEWIGELCQKAKPAEVAQAIRDNAKVSNDAAIIALNNALSPGFVYARVDRLGKVVFSSRSDETKISGPDIGLALKGSALYKQAEDVSLFEYKGWRHYWLRFKTREAIPDFVDERGWREILEQILDDVGVADKKLRQTTKMQINGVISSNNRKGLHPEEFFAQVKQRFCGRGGVLESAAVHPLFEVVLAQRIAEFHGRSS